MRPRSGILVGRDEQVRAIDRALADARAGQGRVVFVTGEGGIGKTRFAAEAADLALGSGMRLLRGRGSGVGPSMPFRPLAEALLGLQRHSSDLDLAQLGPYLPALGRLVPEWAGAGEFEAPGSLLVLAEAFLRVASLAGRGRGCLIILDDLHDVDAETLSVVDYLVDNVTRQPTVLLGLVRTGPSAALDLAQSAAQRGAGLVVELRRLGRPELARLLVACVDPPVPAEVVERIWADSAGNPFIAEELLGDLIADRRLTLHEGVWRLRPGPRTQVPVTLGRVVARRVEELGQQVVDTVLTAAVLGRRFPLVVLQPVTGLNDRDLLSSLQAAATAQLVTPDPLAPDWYAFAHPLIAEALQSMLPPGRRAATARRAAEAVEASFPDLPGEWCQMAVSLRLQAGDHTAAGAHLIEAGRRALAAGAASSAVAFLDQAHHLVRGDAQLTAEVLETLPYALAEAGLVERALDCASELDRLGEGIDARHRAALHTHLAWAANVAGRTADGLAQVELARRLLGPDASAEETAAVDVVAAHLVLDAPGPARLEQAEEMARRAATVAERAGLAVPACQAWQLLGSLIRWHDLDAATDCLERARSLAIAHGLPLWELHALVRLGNDDAIRRADLDRLEQARDLAVRMGAVTAACQAEASIALQLVLAGDFDRAAGLLDELVTTAGRLKLNEILQYVVLTRAVLNAHQARRPGMEAALAEFRRHGGEQSHHASRVFGLGRGFCALLEESPAQARAAVDEARRLESLAPTALPLSGQHGLAVLLTALADPAGPPGARSQRALEEALAHPVGRLRWNRQFVVLAGAVLAGRSHRPRPATEAVDEALAVAQPFAMARHLCLRLAGEEALRGGWGRPVEWLREAEEYFHAAGISRVAGACRSLLRQAGIQVSQHREGSDRIPAQLRAHGLTTREFEILRLLAQRLSNKEIADRLFLSPRTVEKHVASMISKTGLPDRVALAGLITELDSR